MKGTSNLNNISLYKNIKEGLGLIVGAIIEWAVSSYLLKELPPLIFLICFMCLVFSCLYWVVRIVDITITYHHLEKERVSVWLEQKKDEWAQMDAMEYRENSLEYGLGKDELIRRTRKSRNRKLATKKVRLVFSIATLGVICLSNPCNLKAMVGNVGDYITYPKEEKEDKDSVNRAGTETASVIQEEEDDEKTEVLSENETGKTERKKKPESYNFVLENVDRVMSVDKEILNQVYFIDINRNKQDIELIVGERFNHIYNSKKEQVDISMLTDNKNCQTASTYEVLEADFKQRVEECKYMEYLDEWEEKAPGSDEMEDYILGREILNTINVDGRQGCYALWWKLANDYQYYALEYEKQTDNQSAVFYYYTMSIYSCMEAMKYDISDSEYKEAFEYIKGRYKDIAREDSIISQEYKDIAKEIENILIEIL